MASREDVRAQLTLNRFMAPEEARFKHGRCLSPPELDACRPPKTTWKSRHPPRDDHDCPSWLTASEYEDNSSTLMLKIKKLADLIRMSKRTSLYTGAGISASVIGQAARSNTNKQGWTGTKTAASPTLTHHALAALTRNNLVHSWVQQNHDGLPQKAGAKQGVMNEIHGSWFDPFNPVVKYSGCLSDRLEPKMVEDARQSDLVIVLGTSLGGLNADQMATLPATRSLVPDDKELVTTTVRNGVKLCGYITSTDEATGEVCGQFHADTSDFVEDAPWDGAFDTHMRFHPSQTFRPVLNTSTSSLGTVCINLQQTPQDDKMSLRIFGKSDNVLFLLLQELGMSTRFPEINFEAVPRRVLVPYNKRGERIADGEPMMWWNLERGAEIKLTPGHNIQGARQPIFMHIGSKKWPNGTRLKNNRICGPGNGRVVLRNLRTSAFEFNIEGAKMSLGMWWVEAAVAGGVDYLPLVNSKPEYEIEEEKKE
ncbi:hypothetical protein TrST_g5835 [Triparma strigata]|uniref:Deacetylase sirtuin-type domain-containing protein n=1 Tax=Triparma strigata TaxID=1606541 RepID=A0A9W7B5L6_9STRA|nr:hypothetical protein TrST_g5835 [Triparma strigata]